MEDVAAPSVPESPTPVRVDGPPPAPPESVEVTVTRRLPRLGWGMLVDAGLSFCAMEAGFLYTITAFVRRPRQAFESYLGAERLRFSNPLKLVFFLVAISTFLNYQLGTMTDISTGFSSRATEQSDSSELTAERLAALDQLLRQNYNLLLLASLPLLATVSRLFYWKRAYNWMEHLALNSFIFAVYTAAYILQLGIAQWLPWIGLIYVAGSLFYQSWVYRRVMGPGWVRAISATVSGMMLYVLAFALVVAGWLIATTART